MPFKPLASNLRMKIIIIQEQSKSQQLKQIKPMFAIQPFYYDTKLLDISKNSKFQMLFFISPVINFYYLTNIDHLCPHASMIRQNTIFWQKQTAPRCVIKTHVAVQKEKIGRRAIIYTIISRCSDAHSHLIFERNDGIRTGYAPEAESRTWSSRLL